MGEVLQFPVEKHIDKKETTKPSKPSKAKRRDVDIFNAGTHTVFGLSIATTAKFIFPEIGAIEVVGILIGSLLPDIDHRNSTFGKYNPFARTKLMKHRGHCHSIIGASLLSIPFAFFGLPFFYSVLAGSIGHLVADKVFSLFPRKRRFELKLW